MTPPPPPPKTLARRLLHWAAAVVMVPFLLFEEWGWGPLAAAMRGLARLPLWAKLERRIAGLPPWAALAAFGLPMLALLPIKLLALYLFSLGQPAWGLVLLLSAKVAGTALVAWLFQITQPALMKMRWFAYAYPRWKLWKDQLLDSVRASAPWRGGKRALRRMRRACRRIGYGLVRNRRRGRRTRTTLP